MFSPATGAKNVGAWVGGVRDIIPTCVSVLEGERRVHQYQNLCNWLSEGIVKKY